MRMGIMRIARQLRPCKKSGFAKCAVTYTKDRFPTILFARGVSILLPTSSASPKKIKNLRRNTASKAVFPCSCTSMYTPVGSDRFFLSCLQLALFFALRYGLRCGMAVQYGVKSGLSLLVYVYVHSRHKNAPRLVLLIAFCRKNSNKNFSWKMPKNAVKKLDSLLRNKYNCNRVKTSQTRLRMSNGVYTVLNSLEIPNIIMMMSQKSRKDTLWASLIGFYSVTLNKCSWRRRVV